MVPLDQFSFADSWFCSSTQVQDVPMDIFAEEWKKYGQRLLSLAEHWMLSLTLWTSPESHILMSMAEISLKMFRGFYVEHILTSVLCIDQILLHYIVVNIDSVNKASCKNCSSA
ncbi:hypothetical protein H5410_017186 [Solanum commersonii]|uniref:Uncharacterized protein n=1 Tax=Solanum commersonii TaxID=4109 RepID=A0A9J5ZZB8_SOLCO|nr:hypothetical protein H5410_017186 [Solanum commersonii]